MYLPAPLGTAIMDEIISTIKNFVAFWCASMLHSDASVSAWKHLLEEEHWDGDAVMYWARKFPTVSFVSLSSKDPNTASPTVVDVVELVLLGILFLRWSPIKSSCRAPFLRHWTTFGVMVVYLDKYSTPIRYLLEITEYDSYIPIPAQFPSAALPIPFRWVCLESPLSVIS